MIPNPILKTVLICYMNAVAAFFQISPYKLQAVCTVESRKHGSGFEVGKIAKSKPYWGPGGLNEECFEDKDMVKNPYSNIYFVGKTLAKYEDFVQALRNYNREFTWSYYREILRIERLLRKEHQAELALSSSRKQPESSKHSPEGYGDAPCHVPF